MKKYDLIVLGAGPAGEKAAARAAYFGKSVAIVEKHDQPGGAGVHTGTIPSKTLRETALYFSGKLDKGLFGTDRDLNRNITVEDFYYRKRYVENSEVEQINENLIKHGIKLYHGYGVFDDDHHIRILGPKEEVIWGKYILIATGSYPFHPPTIPFDYIRVHDSDSILSLNRLPSSICIVGAGVIGCEYSTIFRAMGIPVILIDGRDFILPFLDKEISDALIKQMMSDGIEIILNTGLEGMEVPESEQESMHVRLRTGEILNIDMLLFAASRAGNTSKLRCENAGIEIGKDELVKVDRDYRSTRENIFAVGDCIGFPALASISMDQGRVAVSKMFGEGDTENFNNIFPYAIYTVPEVSMVGVTEGQAKDQGIGYCLGKAYHRDTARGKIMGILNGFLKLIADRNDQSIVGVHMIGHLSSELIHYGCTLVQERKTLTEVISVVFNYPTLHDLYKYAAYDALGALQGHQIR